MQINQQRSGVCQRLQCSRIESGWIACVSKLISSKVIKCSSRFPQSRSGADMSGTNAQFGFPRRTAARSFPDSPLRRLFLNALQCFSMVRRNYCLLDIEPKVYRASHVLARSRRVKISRKQYLFSNHQQRKGIEPRLRPKFEQIATLGSSEVRS